MRENQEVLRPREAILEAAISLFGKRGYAGTTMRDIAKEVGVLPGSLYAHISSKETLLDEIVELGIESFLAIEAQVPASGSVIERLRVAVKAHVRVAAEHPGRSLVVFHQWRFLTEPQAQRLVGAYGLLLGEILGDARERGDLGPSFGPELTGAEVRYLMGHEWARFPEDILWRRSKLGLTMPPQDCEALAAFMARGA